MTALLDRQESLAPVRLASIICCGCGRALLTNGGLSTTLFDATGKFNFTLFYFCDSFHEIARFPSTQAADSAAVENGWLVYRDCTKSLQHRCPECVGLLATKESIN